MFSAVMFASNWYSDHRLELLYTSRAASRAGHSRDSAAEMGTSGQQLLLLTAAHHCWLSSWAWPRQLLGYYYYSSKPESTRHLAPRSTGSSWISHNGLDNILITLRWLIDDIWTWISGCMYDDHFSSCATHPLSGYRLQFLQLKPRCTGGQVEHSTLGFQELVHFEWYKTSNSWEHATTSTIVGHLQ